MGVAPRSCGATPLFIVSVGIGETRFPLVPRSFLARFPLKIHPDNTQNGG